LRRRSRSSRAIRKLKLARASPWTPRRPTAPSTGRISTGRSLPISTVRWQRSSTRGPRRRFRAAITRMSTSPAASSCVHSARGGFLRYCVPRIARRRAAGARFAGALRRPRDARLPRWLGRLRIRAAGSWQRRDHARGERRSKGALVACGRRRQGDRRVRAVGTRSGDPTWQR
jgi:hypothetical protein